MKADVYLGQLKTLNRRIENKQREAAMWRDIAESMGSLPDGERVQSSGSKDKLSGAVARVVDYEREAEALTWKLINLQHKIILMVDSMDTAEHSLILSEHYVHGLSLMQIAVEWGVSFRHIKRIKSAAIAEFERKYADEL